MKAVKLFFIYCFSLFIMFSATDSYSQQSNFQIAPSPIAYPYFYDGQFDGTFYGSYVKISAQEMSMRGGLIDFKGRRAFSELMALDGDIGFTGLGGSMPGVLPMMPIYTSDGYTPYYTESAGDATLAFLSLRTALNLELQLIHNDIWSLIVFGGMSVNLSRFTIDSPFNLIVPPGYSNAGQVYTGFTNTLTINSTLAGWQCGVQCEINLGNGLRLSPFFMYCSFAGKANVTDKTNVSGTDSYNFNNDIKTSSATSFGMDIIFDDFSIGTLLQQLRSSDSSNQDTHIMTISVNYHFSSNDSTTTAETNKITDQIAE